MHLTDFARKVPADGWARFEPILPAVIWCGHGCPPSDNREGLPAVLDVLVPGMGWRMLPAGFASSKTGQRRLKIWRHQEACRTAWQHLAQRDEALPGSNWDEVLLDGAKKAAKTGGRRPGRAPGSAANGGGPCT